MESSAKSLNKTTLKNRQYSKHCLSSCHQLCLIKKCLRYHCQRQYHLRRFLLLSYYQLKIENNIHQYFSSKNIDGFINRPNLRFRQPSCDGWTANASTTHHCLRLVTQWMFLVLHIATWLQSWFCLNCIILMWTI